MIREDLTKDLHALANAHTKAIGTLLEEFNDDQMMLMIETEQAFDDNTPKQPNADRTMEPTISTCPIIQSNKRKEPILEQLAEESSNPRSDPVTIPKE